MTDRPWTCPEHGTALERVSPRGHHFSRCSICSRFEGDDDIGDDPVETEPEQCPVWGTKEHHGIPDYPMPCILPAGHDGAHMGLVFTYPDGTKG
jgi:hypothetical protein